MLVRLLASAYDAALNVRRWGNPQSDVDQVVRPQEGLQRISGPPLVKKKPLCFSSTIASLSSSL